MSLANWTTRFLAGSAQGSEGQPEGQAPDRGATIRKARRRTPRRLLRRQPRRPLPDHEATGRGRRRRGVQGRRRDAQARGRDQGAARRARCATRIFLERFPQEAQLHAKLSHPNVASVHAFLHEGDKQFMVMEYVAGISLDEFVRGGGPVPVERALSIFRRALDGIEHAHHCGIVHRDIKPANIMLADNGQVKVMDFGIARALDSQERLTRLGQVAGTAKVDVARADPRCAGRRALRHLFARHRAVHAAGRPRAVRWRQRPGADEGAGGAGAAAAARPRRQPAPQGGSRGDAGAGEGSVGPLPDRGRVLACARCMSRRADDDPAAGARIRPTRQRRRERP